MDYTPAIALIQSRGYRLELALELLQHVELTVLDRAALPKEGTTND